MRIAIIGDPIDQQSAGIHVFTKEMVRAMIEVNTEHELFLVREKIDQQFQNIEQVEVKRASFPGSAAWRKFVTVPRVLNRMKMDVVIEPAHFGPWNLNKEIKRVTIIHDLTPILFPHFHRRLSALLQQIFLPGILKRTDLIVANSENTKNDICKVYPKVCDKVIRIYPGVNSIFRADPNREILRKLKIEQPYFLSVGTIEPRKNIPLLLKAYEMYREKEGTKVQLLLVGGKGWKSKEIYRLLESHPYKEDIIQTGYISAKDLPAIYTHAECLIYPSLYEGFGFPVLEAMSCGTPVLAADNSSLPEVGGSSALYYNSSDYSTLLEQMVLIVSRKEKKLANAKIPEFAKQFDWLNFSSQLFTELNSIK